LAVLAPVPFFTVFFIALALAFVTRFAVLRAISLLQSQIASENHPRNYAWAGENHNRRAVSGCRLLHGLRAPVLDKYNF
jgi:hypothetical protein